MGRRNKGYRASRALSTGYREARRIRKIAEDIVMESKYAGPSFQEALHHCLTLDEKKAFYKLRRQWYIVHTAIEKKGRR